MTSDIKPDTHLYPRTTAVPTAQPPMGSPAAAGISVTVPTPTVPPVAAPASARIEPVPVEPARFGSAVADSAVMRSMLASLERIAPTDGCVLLEGEPGIGKKVLARALHDASARAKAPFVVFDCTLASTGVLEPELFGLERSTSGGIRKGALENAEGGTLVLDEVADLPLDLQTKLARALESKEYRRVGGMKPLRVDARLISISRRDLKHEAERGRFQSDLLSRIGASPFAIPALRTRREDVRPLVVELLRQLSDANPGAGPFTASDDTIASLACHEWPGNVRELRGVLDRAVEGARLTGEREIKLIGLPGSSERLTDPYTFQPGRTYRETRARFEAEFERRYVKWLLGRHHGNISAAAREVQMDRKYLYDLAKKHGMRGKEDHDS